MSRTGRSIQAENILLVGLGLQGLGRNGGVSFGSDENVLKWIVMMAAQHGKYTKSHLIVSYKCVNCIVCDSYLSETVTKKKRD